MTELPDLARTELLDCSGRVSHVLSLLLDGGVQVEVVGSRTVVVDPVTGSLRPPGAQLPSAVLDRARAMRPW